MWLCWIMQGWNLSDVRALDYDEYTALIKLIKEGKIRPPMVM